MKVDINKLKQGDVVYWNEGKKYFSGVFVKKGVPIIDLNTIVVNKGSGIEENILEIFLCEKDQYEKAVEEGNAKALKQAKQRKEKVVVTKAPKEFSKKEKAPVEKTVSKYSIKGINELLSKEGSSIERKEVFYNYELDGTPYKFYGNLKSLYDIIEKGGVAAFIAEAAKNEKTKDKKSKASSCEIKPTLKGINTILEGVGAKMERVGKWFELQVTTVDGVKHRINCKLEVKQMFDFIQKNGVEKLIGDFHV